MTKPIRWGVLGAARFARTTTAPAIHDAGNSILAAIATRDVAKAAPFAALAPGLRVFDTYDALLADTEIDAVYIPLPNALHVEWCERAVNAGKHVLCEKPIAMDVAEIDRLIALRDASGLMIAEAYMIPHHPQWHLLQKLVRDGAIGDLLHIDSAFTFGQPDPGNIRLNPDLGGGALRDIGVYSLGCARLVTGQEPIIEAAELGWYSGVDVSTRILARFGDTTCSIFMNIMASTRQVATFHGSRGFIEMEAPFNPGSYREASVRVVMADGAEHLTRFPLARQYVTQIEAFGAAIHGAVYPVPLEFSRGTQAAIEAVFAAA